MAFRVEVVPAPEDGQGRSHRLAVWVGVDSSPGLCDPTRSVSAVDRKVRHPGGVASEDPPAHGADESPRTRGPTQTSPPVAHLLRPRGKGDGGGGRGTRDRDTFWGREENPSIPEGWSRRRVRDPVTKSHVRLTTSSGPHAGPWA